MTQTTHANLAEALAAFQAECPTLPKDATNPHYKSRFTPLDTMVEVVGPLLSKHGLSWSAFPCFAEDGAPALRYVLRHTSGEVESEAMPLLVTKADPQGMGSAITYARRYSLAAVLNLVADEDDDGNATRRQPTADQPFGRPYDKEWGTAIGEACTGLTGSKEAGRELVAVLKKALGGYLPQAAAVALVEADKATLRIPEIEAPEPS